MYDVSDCTRDRSLRAGSGCSFGPGEGRGGGQGQVGGSDAGYSKWLHRGD